MHNSCRSPQRCARENKRLVTFSFSFLFQIPFFSFLTCHMFLLLISFFISVLSVGATDVGEGGAAVEVTKGRGDRRDAR